jgi:hypothetical protein
MSKKKRIFFETEEVVRKTRRGYIDLNMDYFQFYNIAFHYIASLSNNCAKDFILWIMSRVDGNNEFMYNKTIYDDFIKDLATIARPKTYTENTLHVSIRELIDNKILDRIGRGKYRVNPALFWSDDTTKRIEAVRILESNSRVNIPESNYRGHNIPQVTNPIDEPLTPVEYDNAEMFPDNLNLYVGPGIADNMGPDNNRGEE